jgi:hypothetical protein
MGSSGHRCISCDSVHECPRSSAVGLPFATVAAVDTIQTVTVSRRIQFAMARFIEDFTYGQCRRSGSKHSGARLRHHR